jgi:thiamine biosynthesis lipoprotein
MTTDFAVILSGCDAEYARQASDAAFLEIDHIERLLSRFEASSDVSQINLLKPGNRVRVASETMECLLSALWVHSETGGAFDVTVGPIVDRETQRSSRSNVSGPETDEYDRVMERIGMSHLVLDPDHFTVGVSSETPDAGVSVDLGGIGKGFAVDKAAEILAEWDLNNAVIHGGTSTVLALGHMPQHEGWPLGIGGNWGAKAGIDTVILSETALSGSGKEVKGEHVIDPASGKVAGSRAAWAIAPSAAVADGLSTAFMVMPPGDILKLCSRHEGIGALVVTGEGSILRSGIEAHA